MLKGYQDKGHQGKGVRYVTHVLNGGDVLGSSSCYFLLHLSHCVEFILATFALFSVSLPPPFFVVPP